MLNSVLAFGNKKEFFAENDAQVLSMVSISCLITIIEILYSMLCERYNHKPGISVQESDSKFNWRKNGASFLSIYLSVCIS